MKNSNSKEINFPICFHLHVTNVYAFLNCKRVARTVRKKSTMTAPHTFTLSWTFKPGDCSSSLSLYTLRTVASRICSTKGRMSIEYRLTTATTTTLIWRSQRNVKMDLNLWCPRMNTWETKVSSSTSLNPNMRSSKKMINRENYASFVHHQFITNYRTNRRKRRPSLLFSIIKRSATKNQKYFLNDLPVESTNWHNQLNRLSCLLGCAYVHRTQQIFYKNITLSFNFVFILEPRTGNHVVFTFWIFVVEITDGAVATQTNWFYTLILTLRLNGIICFVRFGWPNDRSEQWTLIRAINRTILRSIIKFLRIKYD